MAISISTCFRFIITLLTLLYGSSLPTPTPAQLKYQVDSIMALIHFNMATFYEDGDPGCNAGNWLGPTGSNNVNNFAPSNLNISEWADVMDALHIKSAVLTAKHGCGFYLFQPQNVTLPDGTPYPYHVNVTTYGDVIEQFSTIMAQRNIAHGFYYSLTNNFFLNVHSHYVQNTTLLPGQVNVTQAEFEAIAFNSVKELWTRYSSLGEIWFDGGYEGDMKNELQQVLQQYQPDALCFGGLGICNSSARWCGTEGGNPPGYPTIWSTWCPSTGEVNGCPPNRTDAIWLPSGVDFTLQQGDHWFYTPGDGVHSLSDLISTYHQSVGCNGKLELDFAISRTGQLDPIHVARYLEFANWIDNCYGTPIGSTIPPVGAMTATITFPTLTTFDRIMIQEDLSYSQLIYGYQVDYLANDNTTWLPFSNAITVGNKKIDVGNITNTTAVRLTIVDALASTHISNFAVFSPDPCVIPTTKVQFVYTPTNQCLITNSSLYPCPGGTGNSCPLFLGDCNDPTALWDDSQSSLINLYWSTQLNIQASVNIDCDYLTPNTVAKVLQCDGCGNTIVFTNGQLVYNNGGNTMCLNNGFGTKPNHPCNSAEPYLWDQVQIQACNDATTTGWSRVVVKE